MGNYLHVTESEIEATEKVLHEGLVERGKQDRKWGRQDHPQVSEQMIFGWSSGPLDLCSMYGLPSAKRAKQLTDTRARSGDLDFVSIPRRGVRVRRSVRRARPTEGAR